MSTKLKEDLLKFQAITKNIISKAEEGDYDEVNELFRKRQEVIEDINQQSYSNQEFAAIYKELDIEKHDDDLKNAISTARQSVKEEIDKLSEGKNARKEYTKQFSVDSLFYNKKI